MDNSNHLLEAIYFEQRRQLFACALAVTRCPDLAEDAVHDAFCRLAARPLAAQDPKAYVFRAVRNAAVDLFRRRGRPTEELGEALFDPGPGPAELAGEAQFRERVAVALKLLKDEEHETIVQHLWGGLTLREIAELRGAPQGTVASWYRRGLERMRKELGSLTAGGYRL